jgi:hypothetical protein
MSQKNVEVVRNEAEPALELPECWVATRYAAQIESRSGVPPQAAQ